MLWQKYLQRKAFPFAAETATDALVAQLKMCFVAHDRGESDDALETEDWSLEPEPVPAEVDNWARMQLSVRQKHIKKINDLSPVSSKRRTQTRQRASEAKIRLKSAGGREKPQDRCVELEDYVQIDDDEEKMRDARQQEEARRRDRENKVRQNEKANEAEQQRVQALHEEMSRRLHTFDSNGDLIWVEDVKVDRLPPVQAMCGGNVKKDPRAKGADDSASAKGKDSPVGKKASKGRRRFDRSLKGADPDEFPDGFSKLQHGQPPILETMVVKPGVVLDVYGKSKAGPPAADKAVGMSRKEYVSLTEKEVAYENQFSSQADGSAELAGDSTPHGGPPGTAGSQVMSRGLDGGGGLGATSLAEGSSGQDGSVVLPPVPGASSSTSRPGGRAATTSGGNRPGTQTQAHANTEDKKKDRDQVQKAPTAPTQQARSKKMQSIGHLGHPPRLHVAPLGGPYGYGVAQPPLGATMGHGLVRHGSAKESYFFPRGPPEIPSLLRATSEVALGPKGRGSPRRSSPRHLQDSRSQTAPSKSYGSLDSDMAYDSQESPRHGMIRPEKKGAAYRGMRQTLFPNSLGGSGYVAGMA